MVEQRLEALRVLCGHTASGAPLGSKNERNATAASSHKAEFRGLVYNHIHAKHGKIDIEDFNNRPSTSDRRSHSDANHAGFGDRRIADAGRAVFIH